MEYIERVQWVEACQMFFDAYVKFQMDGTKAHWYECNNRNIEIAFSGDSDRVSVQLYCPEILRSLLGDFGITTERNEETISMLHWLIWEAEEPGVYSIETADSEHEYNLLRVILTERYSRCYYRGDDDWKGEGEERFIIVLHGKQFRVCCEPDEFRYIIIKLVCIETSERFQSVVLMDEDDPEEIIREIQRMAWEDELRNDVGKSALNVDETAFDYIHGVVEWFINLFDAPLMTAEAKLSAWINRDEHLSQDPLATVPNIRILTTKGYVDIYFFADASDKNIPYSKTVDFDPKPEIGDSCLFFSVNGIYIDFYIFDQSWTAHVIEHVAPQFSSMILNALYSEEG